MVQNKIKVEKNNLKYLVAEQLMSVYMETTGHQSKVFPSGLIFDLFQI